MPRATLVPPTLVPPALLDPAARFTFTEAAEHLGRSLQTVLRWALGKGSRGVVLKSYVLGGRRYILRADVERFLAETQEAAHAS